MKEIAVVIKVYLCSAVEGIFEWTCDYIYWWIMDIIDRIGVYNFIFIFLFY